MRKFSRLSMSLLVGCSALLLHADVTNVITIITPSKGEECKMEEILERGEALWKMTDDEFMSEYERYEFKWTSGAQTTARAYTHSGANLTWMELPVIEALADFGASKTLSKLTVVLYTRGDAYKSFYMKDFRSLVASAQKASTAWAGADPVDTKAKPPSPSMKFQALAWIKDSYQITGEWSYSERQDKSQYPEFIRLRVEKFNPAKDPRSGVLTSMNAMRAGRKGEVSKGALKRNVTKEDNGDIVIKSVPMVDQGMKGYCSVATAERILSYYGLEVDQHVMAQLAKSSALGGTVTQLLLKGLREAGPNLGARLKAS